MDCNFYSDGTCTLSKDKDGQCPLARCGELTRLRSEVTRLRRDAFHDPALEELKQIRRWGDFAKP